MLGYTQNRNILVTRAVLLAAVAVSILGGPALAQWPQFGGPNRDFSVPCKGLADKWPEGGPKKLWQRELGDGYSTIVVDGGLLFTMYRVGEDEFSVALDAKTGKTVWEHKNHSPFTEVMAQFGPGPHTTPLVDGDLVYTIGTNAMLHAFEKKSGDVIWKKDLAKEMNAYIPDRGYGASPIIYKDLIILPVDHPREEGKEGESEGEPQSIVAFNKRTGDLDWASQNLPVSYASPLLVKFDGQDVLACMLQKDFIGLKPESGQLLWRHEIKPEGANITTPVFDGKDTFFCSSAYDSGSRAIKLSKKEGKIATDELWYSRKMRVHHGNVIRIGDYVYGSSGDFGPAFFMAVNMKSGEVAWRERGFTKATCVHADGKLILLDEDGQLALVSADPRGMKILSQAKVGERYAWATPTLVDTTLFVRDRKHIMALDLAATSG